MNYKERFTSAEWQSIVEATALSGICIINADKSNLIEVIKELVAYSSALVEAETAYKTNSLLTAIISELREDTDKHFHKMQSKALKENAKDEILDLLKTAVECLKLRANAMDYAIYRHFLIKLLERIANASGEGTFGFILQAISPEEDKMLRKIRGILG